MNDEKILETMNEEMENEELDTELEVCEIEEDDSKGDLAKKLVIGAAVVTGAVVLWVKKGRALYEKATVKRLKKKGYIVLTPEETVEAESKEIEDVENEEVNDEFED